jgi:hypothetical protein
MGENLKEAQRKTFIDASIPAKISRRIVPTVPRS